MKKGKVAIIGVGSGDYKLMTLKAVEEIKNADAVVYDRLINSKILDLAKAGAELIYVGKMPHLHIVPQEEINQVLLKLALEGKTIARVKGGDPFVFGRGGEEAAYLHQHGVAFEIVPGVTSAIAAAAYAGIPVTHRDYASSFHVITGHEKPGKSESFLDYEVLARLEGTLVFLMGIQNAEEITKNLMHYGKDRGTLVAVVEKGTTVDQRVVTATLETLVEVIQKEGIESPAVIVIGKVVELHGQLAWFGRLPLSGKRIVVTRPKEQAERLIQKLEALGAEVISFPTIRIEANENTGGLDEILEKLIDYNWLVFTSVNGVKTFFNRMKVRRVDIRRLSHIKLGAIGDVTASELEARGLLVDYVPQEFTTTALVTGLKKVIQPKEKVLIARGDLGNPELLYGLEEQGIECHERIIYKTLENQPDQSELIDLLDNHKINCILFTSPSTVKGFMNLLGNQDIKEKLSHAKIVSIGPVTTEAVQNAGLVVAGQADTYTEDGLVEKLLELLEEQNARN